MLNLGFSYSTNHGACSTACWCAQHKLTLWLYGRSMPAKLSHWLIFELKGLILVDFLGKQKDHRSLGKTLSW